MSIQLRRRLRNCFFVDPVNRICGSCHASWKGSLVGIFEKEVETFVTKYGSDKKNIICVVCPSIGIENFEVDMDVAQKFVDFKSYVKPHVDLPNINYKILLRCGLLDNNLYIIDDMDMLRDEKFWHSFRRGPIVDGKHLNGQNGYWIKIQ